jgi:hypothetical protein
MRNLGFFSWHSKKLLAWPKKDLLESRKHCFFERILIEFSRLLAERFVNFMTIIKRSRSDSTSDLVSAITALVPLLQDQKEKEAAQELLEASTDLAKATPGSAEHKAAIAKVIEAFEGDHELLAYTFQRGSSAGQWTEVEQLAEASSRVISLARRMQ